MRYFAVAGQDRADETGGITLWGAVKFGLMTARVVQLVH